MVQKHQTLEPIFCPLHNIPGPCMLCLAPEVAIKIGMRDRQHEGILFQSVDVNAN